MEKFKKLSRAEMKGILGGLVGGGCHSNCTTDEDCKMDGYTCNDDSSEVCPDRKTCGPR
ncbi:bacteriocin-like protein [Mucilaginibacter segetis]